MNSYSLHDFRTKVQGIPVSPTPSGEPTIVTAPDAVYGSRLRHRVAALCSGFGGLTATKALNYAQVNITDGVVFLVRITAQGTSYIVNQTPLWLQDIPAIAGLAAAVGAIIGTHVTRTPRRAGASSRTAQCVQLATSASRSPSVGTETTVTAPDQ